MPVDPLIQKLIDRHAELKRTVEEYTRIISEYHELTNTIENLKRHFPEYFESMGAGSLAGSQDGTSTTTGQNAPSPSGVPLPLRLPPQPKIQLAVAAKEILMSEDRLHAIDLLARLRLRGWAGSGDDRKDIRNIASTLGLRPTIFHNYGKNTWGLESRFQPSAEPEEVTQ